MKNLENLKNLYRQIGTSLMSDLKKIRLDSICNIKSGKTNSQDALDEGEFPLFDRSRDIKRSDKYIFDLESVILPGEGKDFYPRYYSGKFDLHQRAYSISAINPKEVDTKFVYFSLIKNREYFAATATGATVKSLRLPQIGALEITVPDIKSQKQIANILTDYENLIEINNRKIDCLEKTLNLVYEEIFTSNPDFETWPLTKLSEFIKVDRGVSYSSEEIDDFIGTYNIVNLKNFNRGGGFRTDGTKFYTGSVNESHLVTEGDIVIAVTDMTHDRVVVARPARIPRLNGSTVFSADVVKVSSKTLPNSYLYQLFSSYRFTETTKFKANGSNVLHLKPTAIGEFKTHIPPQDVLLHYEEISIPIIENVHKLILENSVLGKMFEEIIEQIVSGRG